MDRFDRLSGKVRSRLVRGLALGVAVLALALPATVLGVLPADVAVVAGKPIKRQGFDHWMFVVAKSSTAPGQPAIVPTDPPRAPPRVVPPASDALRHHGGRLPLSARIRHA